MLGSDPCSVAHPWSSSPSVKEEGDSPHIKMWLGASNHVLVNCRGLGIINMFSTLGGGVFGGKGDQRVSLALGQRNHRWARVGDFWRLELLCVSWMMVGRGQGGAMATAPQFLVLGN